MSVYTETIKLEDNVSGPAEKAAKEMGILQGVIASTENALVKAQATGNIKKYQALSKDLESYKGALSLIPPVQQEATRALEGSTSAGAGFQAELAELTGGLSIVVEAIGAVAVGFGAMVVAGAAFAIKATEAKNASIALFDALGEGNISGKAVEEMLTDLSAKLGLGKEQLGGFAKQMLAIGITDGPALAKATEANASAFYLMGEKGVMAFQKVMKGTEAFLAGAGKMKNPLKEFSKMGLGQGEGIAEAMGISVKQLASQIKNGTVDAKKFGDAMQDALIKKGKGPMENASLSVANLGTMLQQNITEMFNDMGDSIKPFMKEVKDLFNIFDSKTKPSGMALKTGITGFFKEVFAVATKVVPYIKYFLLDLVIWGLKAYIGLKPIVKWFQQLSDSQEVVTVFWTALNGLGTAALVVAGAIGAIVTVAAVVFGALWGLQILFVTISGVILGFAADATKAMAEWAASAVGFASDFISGLVMGLSNGVTSVVDAVTGLADKAKGAFISAMKIGSPSKVMMELGGFVGEGAAQGIEGSGDTVANASASLAGAATGGFAAGSSAGGGGSSGVSVVVEAGAIVIDGAGKAAAEITEEMISLLFERVALAQGL